MPIVRGCTRITQDRLHIIICNFEQLKRLNISSWFKDQLVDSIQNESCRYSIESMAMVCMSVQIIVVSKEQSEPAVINRTVIMSTKLCAMNIRDMRHHTSVSDVFLTKVCRFKHRSR